jgi:hypothetical protein
MSKVLKALGILLLLLTAQQGAVDHELSHVFRADQAALKIDSGSAADTTCALCPAFAQALTPAFSHAFALPHLVPATWQPTPEPRFVAVDAAVPRPRSAGRLP